MAGLSNAAKRIILVTGATGRQGGAVARQLLQAGFQVRAMTRRVNGATAGLLAQMGAEIILGDFDDPASLVQVLQGVSGLFAMQTPFEMGANQEIVHGIRLADAAMRAGVSQIVYSSVASAELSTGVAHFESKREIERHIERLSFRYATILRPVVFMEMLLAPGNLRALAAGQVALAFKPETRVAMIAVEDIAAMAKAAFLKPSAWNSKAITLAADAPNFVEVAAAIGTAISRPVTYKQIKPDQLDPETRPTPATQAWLESTGWPVDIAALRASYPFSARTFAQWATEKAAALTPAC
jgi:uncharacterized protein YbjT (DUF2867 family)